MRGTGGAANRVLEIRFLQHVMEDEAVAKARIEGGDSHSNKMCCVCGHCAGGCTFKVLVIDALVEGIEWMEGSQGT